MFVFYAGINFSAAAEGLFDEDATLDITITGSLLAPARERDKTKQYAALLTVAKHDLPIQIQVRGNNRLKKETCTHPPLRLFFDKTTTAETVFKKEGELKLVVQCKNTSRFAEYLRLEFLAYRLFEEVTDHAFKVRWLNVTYQDDAKTVVRPGFFIERKKRMGKRLGVAQVPENSVTINSLNATYAARADLFQYMIGNLDYSIRQAPPDENCCHNVKLMTPADTTHGHIPIPYDFDSSGMVNAPYAVPPDAAKVESVTTRRYRGYCKFSEETAIAREEFLSAEQKILETINADPILKASSKKKATRFLAKFFKTLASDKQFQRGITGRCR